MKKLEDLEITIEDQLDGDSFSGLHDVALIDDLKEEAIKWIKKLRKFDNLYCCSCDDDFGAEIEDNEGTQCWIKHFFDITEEDLIAQRIKN